MNVRPLCQPDLQISSTTAIHHIRYALNTRLQATRATPVTPVPPVTAVAPVTWQALKYEARHDSALARFLLRRALCSPHVLGHQFFWSLRAEMHLPDVSERFGLLLEEYLRCCGPHAAELSLQLQAVLITYVTYVTYVTARPGRSRIHSHPLLHTLGRLLDGNVHSMAT